MTNSAIVDAEDEKKRSWIKSRYLSDNLNAEAIVDQRRTDKIAYIYAFLWASNFNL